MRAALAVTALTIITACTSTSAPASDARPTADTSNADVSVTAEPDTTTAAPSTTVADTTVDTTTQSTATETTTTETTTTETTTTTTTTTEPPLDVFDEACVAVAATDASLERVARSIDPAADVDPTALWIENGFVHSVAAGDIVDICAGNGINDIDGSPALLGDEPQVAEALRRNVEDQQTKLNELFAGLGTGDLAVDGDSGRRTGQRLCGARVALGLDINNADMAPGSDEHVTLFAADALPTPASNAISSERWVVIDRACQLMFIGTGTSLTYVFPTSTGSEGFETRLQDRAEAFRFNPAVENGGWHDSSEFPVGVDNPLNGNMYKPLYFDLGQAIHGANNVPPVPDSKGCARLRVGDQDTLIAWLGLQDAPGETWRKSEMNVTVSVQGEFVPRP